MTRKAQGEPSSPTLRTTQACRQENGQIPGCSIRDCALHRDHWRAVEDFRATRALSQALAPVRSSAWLHGAGAGGSHDDLGDYLGVRLMTTWEALSTSVMCAPMRS